MRKKPVTLKDIADKLNLATSTVSRALNNHPGLKEETKKAVRDLAEALEYYPNPMALGLLQKKSYTIGVIVPEITSHFFSAIITGIQDVIGPTDYNIMICISNESYQEEVTLVKKLSRMRVDGVLVSPSSVTKDFDHFRGLQKKGIPVVVFDRDCPGLEADKVLVDDYSGAYQAVDYLIRSGCTKIAYLSGPKNLSTTKSRLQGYMDALMKNNIGIKKEYIHNVKGFSHNDGLKPAKKLLCLPDLPDAIFAINDNIATAAMHVAKKMGLGVPDDISIIGFDDDPHSSYFSPSLSTVWQPVYSLGMLSARILLQRVKDNNYSSEDFRLEIFKPELVIRSSSR